MMCVFALRCVVCARCRFCLRAMSLASESDILGVWFEHTCKAIRDTLICIQLDANYMHVSDINCGENCVCSALGTRQKNMLHSIAFLH